MENQISAASLLDELAGQSEGAEIYEVRSLQLPVQFRAGALESVKAIETAGRAVRVIADDHLGFSTTTDLRDGETVVQNALESARFGDPVTFRFPTEGPMPEVECFDSRVEQLDEERLIELGRHIVERIESYDPELQIEVSLGRAIERVHLLNTSGLDLDDRRTSFSIGIEVTRTREGDILVIYDSISSRQEAGVDGLDLADQVVEKLRWAEAATSAPTGAMPVVFTPRGAMALLLPLAMGLNGKNVYLETSPLGEKLGQQVLDDQFTLIDDGRMDFAPRSAPYDDEGVPTTRKPLIEGGVVESFLYDLKTASRMGVQPTGNGFKSSGIFGGGFRRPPGVSPATWQIPPGDRSQEQILADLDQALLVDQVLGMGQGNVLSGEFSNNVSLGFLVRDGEVVGRVKNTMIAGNTYDLLRGQLIALGDSPRWVYGMLHVPAIAVDGVSVVSRG